MDICTKAMTLYLSTSEIFMGAELSDILITDHILITDRIIITDLIIIITDITTTDDIMFKELSITLNDSEIQF